MPRTKKRTISFHSLYALSKGRRADVEPPNWVTVFEELGKKSVEELTVGDVVFVPEVLADGRPVLSMHEPLDTAFMTQIDKAHRVSDLLGQNVEDPQVAHSTAVAFLPGLPIVALAQGGQRGCPSITHVVQFLDKALPLNGDSHWASQPTLDPDKLLRFRAEAEGVHSFSARYSTARNLFTPVDDEGILSFTDRVAEHLHGDLEVQVKISLSPDAPSSARARFKAMLSHSLPRIVSNPRSGAKAVAILGNGIHEEMNLVAQRLSIAIDLDQTTSESRRFSALRDRVAAVGAEYEDGLRALREG